MVRGDGYRAKSEVGEKKKETEPGKRKCITEKWKEENETGRRKMKLEGGNEGMYGKRASN